MEENESVDDFFTIFTRLVNQIKVCGEEITTKSIVSSLSKKELQGSLESHEQRMFERTASKTKIEVALQAQSNKDKKGKGKWNGNKGRGGHNNSNNRNSQQEVGSSNKKQNHQG
ncbi:hypothetical protein A2U01_0043111, partial [Trifolium medium]|nr:hypothetical protein [Trifolium medium]